MTHLARLDGVGFSGALALVSGDSTAAVVAAGSVAATSGSAAASSVMAAGVSVVAAAAVEDSAAASSFFSSAFFSSTSFFSLLPPRRAPKIEVRFLLAERLRSSALVSLASSLASSVGASVAATAATGASSAAAGVSSATLGVSSTFLSSTGFSSFLTGLKEAMVDLYFSDSVTVLASSLASAIFSLSWATQLSRSAWEAALKVCLWPLEDRTNLLGPSVVGSAASAWERR